MTMHGLTQEHGYAHPSIHSSVHTLSCTSASCAVTALSWISLAVSSSWLSFSRLVHRWCTSGTIRLGPLIARNRRFRERHTREEEAWLSLAYTYVWKTPSMVESSAPTSRSSSSHCWLCVQSVAFDCWHVRGQEPQRRKGLTPSQHHHHHYTTPTHARSSTARPAPPPPPRAPRRPSPSPPAAAPVVVMFVFPPHMDG